MFFWFSLVLPYCVLHRLHKSHSSFREFLLWPDLEASAPQGGGVELSDYEKLRVARMEVKTEFLRGLGLA